MCETIYNDLKITKPTEGQIVKCGVDKRPLNPKLGVFKNGKFYDKDDKSVEYFPTHWL